jgi:hypothetical protein
MALIHFFTKNSKHEIQKIKVTDHKLSQGRRAHAFDPDSNKDHGIPHVHLNNGKVLNVFTGKIYKGKIIVGSMKKKELDSVRYAIVKNIVSVAEGRFNLDGSPVIIHIDKSDPLPTDVHAHIDNKTFSSDNKVYNLGLSNSNLINFHKKLDLATKSDSILNDFNKLYKSNQMKLNIGDSLRNKLNTLVTSCNISRDYIKKKYNIDFESHNVDYF